MKLLFEDSKFQHFLIVAVAFLSRLLFANWQALQSVCMSGCVVWRSLR